MPLFNVTAREHAYRGRFYSDVVEAESGKVALQLAAEQATAPQPPPGSTPQRGFNVAVTERASAGQLYSDVVQAGSCEEALRLAAGQPSAPQPPPGSTPQPDAANRPCADVWVYSLLHCELPEGHDPPHIAVARGYRRPVRWVRDDRGLAHALPEPTTSPPPITQPPPAPPPPLRDTLTTTGTP